MHPEMEIPSTIPVMTLRDIVFFPQSILPLYIFEPRYRTMLRDVLAGNRIFAVARLDQARAMASQEEEPFCPVATAGMVRASHANADGTSNLVLQGLCRVRIKNRVQTGPYPCAEVEMMEPAPVEAGAELEHLRHEVGQLITSEKELSNDVPEEFLQFLQTIEDPDAFIDLTVHSTCPCPDLRQRLLETLDIESRFRLYLRYLRRQLARSQFFRQLQGGLADDAVSLN